MGNRERNERNDGNATSQDGNAENQGGNTGNQGENSGNEGGNVRNKVRKRGKEWHRNRKKKNETKVYKIQFSKYKASLPGSHVKF